MKKWFLKAKQWSIVALMGLTGASSCARMADATAPDPAVQRPENEKMYGCPETMYNDKPRVEVHVELEKPVNSGN